MPLESIIHSSFYYSQDLRKSWANIPNEFKYEILYFRSSSQGSDYLTVDYFNKQEQQVKSIRVKIESLVENDSQSAIIFNVGLEVINEYGNKTSEWHKINGCFEKFIQFMAEKLNKTFVCAHLGEEGVFYFCPLDYVFQKQIIADHNLASSQQELDAVGNAAMDSSLFYFPSDYDEGEQSMHTLLYSLNPPETVSQALVFCQAPNSTTVKIGMYDAVNGFQENYMLVTPCRGRPLLAFAKRITNSLHYSITQSSFEDVELFAFYIAGELNKQFIMLRNPYAITLSNNSQLFHVGNNVKTYSWPYPTCLPPQILPPHGNMIVNQGNIEGKLLALKKRPSARSLDMLSYSYAFLQSADYANVFVLVSLNMYPPRPMYHFIFNNNYYECIERQDLRADTLAELGKLLWDSEKISSYFNNNDQIIPMKYFAQYAQDSDHNTIGSGSGYSPNIQFFNLPKLEQANAEKITRVGYISFNILPSSARNSLSKVCPLLVVLSDEIYRKIANYDDMGQLQCYRTEFNDNLFPELAKRLTGFLQCSAIKLAEDEEQAKLCCLQMQQQLQLPSVGLVTVAVELPISALQAKEQASSSVELLPDIKINTTIKAEDMQSLVIAFENAQFVQQHYPLLDVQDIGTLENPMLCQNPTLNLAMSKLTM